MSSRVIVTQEPVINISYIKQTHGSNPNTSIGDIILGYLISNRINPTVNVVYLTNANGGMKSIYDWDLDNPISDLNLSHVTLGYAKYENKKDRIESLTKLRDFILDRETHGELDLEEEHILVELENVLPHEIVEEVVEEVVEEQVYTPLQLSPSVGRRSTVAVKVPRSSTGVGAVPRRTAIPERQIERTVVRTATPVVTPTPVVRTQVPVPTPSPVPVVRTVTPRPTAVVRTVRQTPASVRTAVSSPSFQASVTRRSPQTVMVEQRTAPVRTVRSPPSAVEVVHTTEDIDEYEEYEY